MTKKEMYKQLEELKLKKFDLVLIGNRVYEYEEVNDDTLGLIDYSEDDELDFINDLSKMKIVDGEWLDNKLTMTTIDDDHNLYTEEYSLVSGEAYHYKLI